MVDDLNIEYTNETTRGGEKDKDSHRRKFIAQRVLNGLEWINYAL